MIFSCQLTVQPNRFHRTPEVEKYSGLWSVNSKNPGPLARISQVFDVFNKITVAKSMTLLFS